MSSPYANHPVQGKQPLYSSHLMHGLLLARLDTDFRELLLPIFLSTSVCLPRTMGVYLLVSQCWVDSGPTEASVHGN